MLIADDKLLVMCLAAAIDGPICVLDAAMGPNCVAPKPLDLPGKIELVYMWLPMLGGKLYTHWLR